MSEMNPRLGPLFIELERELPTVDAAYVELMALETDLEETKKLHSEELKKFHPEIRKTQKYFELRTKAETLENHHIPTVRRKVAESAARALKVIGRIDAELAPFVQVTSTRGSIVTRSD